MKEEEPFHPDPHDAEAFRIASLVAAFIHNRLTTAEEQELDEWVGASFENQRLFEQMIDESNHKKWLAEMDGMDVETALKKVRKKIAFPDKKRKARVRSLWMAAAACVIIAIAITLLIPKPTKTIEPPVITKAVSNDIIPGSRQATLTLSDGRVVGLDTVKAGSILAQSNSAVSVGDSGKVAYQLVNPTMLPQTEIFNTLTVPAGGQVRVLTLPDGTKVWLNAASSLKYPVVFGGAKRKVELTGEGYFEVAKDPMYPFEVSAGGSTVQVLGTHFNVNAYTDEPAVKVVLAEGAIRLNNSVVLKPGEQGMIAKNGNLEKDKADLVMALAWKNGQFVFRQTPIDMLMRQVARWYNATIVYDAKVPDHFNAEIGRDVPVSKLLHLLEATGSVHFKIENNTITVMN